MFKVSNPGFFTTVQDQGRFGYRNKGVPVSGVMDSISASRANSLLENVPTAALLEITMTGPKLQFDENTFICLTGAELSPKLNAQALKNDTVIEVRKGDILSFGKLIKGFRAYMGIKGGIKEKMVLDSQSYYFPLTQHKYIKENTQIHFDATPNFVPKITELKMHGFLNESHLEVQKGPEFDMLNKNQIDDLFSKEFTVSKNNDRMAYQLAENLEGHSHEILTSATLPGTVQFTPAGKLIILMKDGQTTGGYPRVLQLKEKAVCILAQKKFGDTIKFNQV
jgi:biotin-dependent carboxylase-like uncharacterized protein